MAVRKTKARARWAQGSTANALPGWEGRAIAERKAKAQQASVEVRDLSAEEDDYEAQSDCSEYQGVIAVPVR